ncbi:hypothetical protein FA10DRAFT_257875 [Acaromyces ingoldii]|uniref:Gfd2/YDR514C-like C-terminal domain-containing protein n=1 Tax=Acaromyces ingoldii TaxID=215250 RepID=A0A316Z016_9BASI|nr:hypothetical protein FA10DRAFT_257875 [Acaromyces ingoldii]PWN93623.1 hypothetical protein FA10DRAFT_257875 [Acaromyces ingoldii]
MSAMNNEFSRSKSPFYSEVSYLDQCSGKEVSLGGIEVYVAVVGRDGQKAILLPKAHVTMHVNKLYVHKKTETIIPVPRGRRGINARLVYEDGAEEQGKETVQNLERFVLESQQQLRKLENQVRQHNSEIKRAKDLKQWRSDYEDVRQLWLRSTSTGPVAHFLAIDTECWDQDTRDKDIIIEVGWSLIVPRTGGFQQNTTHFLVQESYEDNLRNGKYVPDNRMRFLFGDESSIDVDTAGHASPWNSCTRIAGLLELGAELSKVIEDLRERGPVYIVFHCAGGDLGVLESLQVNSTHWTFAVSEEVSERNDGINDTDSNGHEDDAESSSTSSSALGPTVANLVQPALRTETADGRPLHAVRVIDTQALFAALQRWRAAHRWRR